MAKPQYHQQEGLWSRGKRKEEAYQAVKLGLPYGEAVEQFRKATEGRVEKLIPHGGDCCHFVVERRKDNGGKNPWHAYSEELGKRALKKLREDRANQDDTTYPC